ncbi:hypothetical protein BC829DRAFT_263378 [Chytridium lagenaria]|nr:hypothetical protein BC829DRAFT_263378 [Chytridium lagenaria]
MGGLFTNNDRSYSLEFNKRVQLWQDAGWNKIDFARTDNNNERWRIPNSSNCYGVVSPIDRKVVIVPCYSGSSYGWGTQWYPMHIGNGVYMYRNAHATDSWGQGQLCLDSAGWPGNGAQPYLLTCDTKNGNQHWYPYWVDVDLEPGPIKKPPRK